MSKSSAKNPSALDNPAIKNSLDANGGDTRSSSSPNRGSILKSKESKGQGDCRSDYFGNQIKKGGKKHKISFKENMADVREVENWKQYNVDDGNNGGPKCCQIF